MDVEVSSPQSAPAAEPGRTGGMLWTRGGVLALWVLALVPLLLFLGTPAVTRTQEARVLETARQMLGHGPRAWLLPILNGEARLRKPPLTYWMAGASFELIGVGEFAGRLPTALCSWLMLGATYAIAARLFGRRAGVLSAAALLGSYLFFRHGRLAETDAPAALFVTLAVYAFWRGVDEASEEPSSAPSSSANRRHHFLWFHLGAIATGLAFFSKGGPGLFPLLFLIALPLVRRRPAVLGRFLLSGAWITVIVVAGWWFAYAATTLGVTQFRAELTEVAEGLDHKAWFWEYVPMLALATAPWVILAVGGLWAGWERRRDPRVAGLIVWGLSIFLPLCVPWNKQFHYLFPLVPCLMVFVGWLVDAAARGTDPALTRAVRGSLIATAVASLVAVAAAPIAAHFAVGNAGAGIWVFAAAGLVLVVGAAAVLVRGGGVAHGALALSAAWAILLAFAVGALAPTLAPTDSRATAAQIRGNFGDGPYVFLGGDTSLPLCFNLRQAIRRGFTAEQIREIVPPGVDPVVVQQVEEPKNAGAVVAPMPQMVPASPVLDVGKAGQRFLVYRVHLGNLRTARTRRSKSPSP